MTDRSATITALPAGSECRSGAPERFASWDADSKERAFALWSTVAGRRASRTEWLLAQEAEGAAIPSASTIRRWAQHEDWEARADDHLEATRGKDLRQLHLAWLTILKASQETLLDSLLGRYDGDPQAGAARLKAAEIALRVLGQAGALTVTPPPPQLSAAERANETPLQGLKRMRDEGHAATQEAQRRR